MQIVKKKCACGRTFKMWEGPQITQSPKCLECCFSVMFSFPNTNPAPKCKVIDLDAFRRAVNGA